MAENTFDRQNAKVGKAFFWFFLGDLGALAVSSRV
jgi:hypothetical protein